MTAVDGYSELEVVIQSLGTFSAVLSFLGCVTILYSIYRKKTYNIITNRLLIFLLLLEVGLSIVYGIGLSGTLDEGVCQFQVIQL